MAEFAPIITFDGKKSYVQVNIYGKRLKDLRYNGVPFPVILNNLECAGSYAFEVPIYHESKVSNMTEEKNELEQEDHWNSANSSFDSVSSLDQVHRTSTPIDSEKNITLSRMSLPSRINSIEECFPDPIRAETKNTDVDQTLVQARDLLKLYEAGQNTFNNCEMNEENNFENVTTSGSSKRKSDNKCDNVTASEFTFSDISTFNRFSPLDKLSISATTRLLREWIERENGSEGAPEVQKKISHKWKTERPTRRQTVSLKRKSGENPVRKYRSSKVPQHKNTEKLDKENVKLPLVTRSAKRRRTVLNAHETNCPVDILSSKSAHVLSTAGNGSSAKVPRRERQKVQRTRSQEAVQETDRNIHNRSLGVEILRNTENYQITKRNYRGSPKKRCTMQNSNGTSFMVEILSSNSVNILPKANYGYSSRVPGRERQRIRRTRSQEPFRETEKENIHDRSLDVEVLNNATNYQITRNNDRGRPTKTLSCFANRPGFVPKITRSGSCDPRFITSELSSNTFHSKQPNESCDVPMQTGLVGIFYEPEVSIHQEIHEPGIVENQQNSVSDMLSSVRTTFENDVLSDYQRISNHTYENSISEVADCNMWDDDNGIDNDQMDDDIGDVVTENVAPIEAMDVNDGDSSRIVEGETNEADDDLSTNTQPVPVDSRKKDGQDSNLCKPAEQNQKKKVDNPRFICKKEPRPDSHPIKCQFTGCKVSYNWRVKNGKMSLVNHVLVHLGKHAFKCHNCDYTDMTTCRMRRHHIRTHKNDGSNLYGFNELSIDDDELYNMWKICFKDNIQLLGVPVRNAKEEL